MQNCSMAPPFVSWAEALSTKRVGEGLCFWPAPNFGQNIGLSFSEDLFFSFFFKKRKKQRRSTSMSMITTPQELHK